VLVLVTRSSSGVHALVGMQVFSNTKHTDLAVPRMCWRATALCHPGPVLYFRQTGIFRQHALIALIELIAEEYFRVNLF